MHMEEIAAATTAAGTGEEEQGTSLRTQSEGDDSDGSSASSCSKKKKYQVISQEVREKFIQKVISKQVTIKEAAREFGLKFSTSKAILQTYKKEGRIGKKKTRQRKPRQLKKGIAQVDQVNQNNLIMPEVIYTKEDGTTGTNGTTASHSLNMNPFQNLSNNNHNNIPQAVSQHHQVIFQQTKDKLEGGINSENQDPNHNLIQNGMQINQIQQQQQQQQSVTTHNNNTVFAHLSNLAAAGQLSGGNSTRHPSNPTNMLIAQQSSNPFLTAMPFSQYPHSHQQHMSQNQPFQLQEQTQQQQQKPQSLLESQYYNLKYNQQQQQQQQQQQLVQLQQQQQRLNQQQPKQSSQQTSSLLQQSPMLGSELMNNYMLFGFPFSLDPSAQQQQMQQQHSWQQQQQQQQIQQQGLSAINSNNNNKNISTSDVLQDVLSGQKTTYGFPLVSSTQNEQYQQLGLQQQGNNINNNTNNNTVAAVNASNNTVSTTGTTVTPGESTTQDVQGQLPVNPSDSTIKKDLSQEDVINFNGSNHNTPTAAIGSNQQVSTTTNLNSSLLLTKGTQNSNEQPQPAYPLQPTNQSILPGTMSFHQQSLLNEFNDSQIFSQFDTSNKRYTHSFPSSDPNSAGPSFNTQPTTTLGQSSQFPSVSFFGTPFLTPANPNNNNNNNNLTPQLYSHKLSTDSMHFNSIFGMTQQQQQQSQPTPVAPNFGFPSIDMSQQYPFLFNSTPQIVSQVPQTMPSPLFTPINLQKNTSL